MRAGILIGAAMWTAAAVGYALFELTGAIVGALTALLITYLLSLV